MSAVVLENIVKRYGSVVALDGLSLEIPEGSIAALIGPNGCGKTTTMGVIAGLLRIDSGRIDVLGKGPFSAPEHAGRVSLMPQDSVPSSAVPIVDSLRYFAELQGLEPQKARREAERALGKVKLEGRARARFGQLSHGMRRRFSIAQAMLGEPRTYEWARSGAGRADSGAHRSATRPGNSSGQFTHFERAREHV
jgi:ABC-type multidrug transport system ATPase subunit